MQKTTIEVPTMALTPSTPKQALRLLNRQIEECERGQKQLDREYDQRSTEFSRRLNKLVRTRDRLRTDMDAKRVRRQGLDPHVQAGRHVVTMLNAFMHGKVLTAAEAARRAGVSSTGTSAWAIKALLDDGVIEPTGYSIGRSAEYRYVPKKKRKDTTLGPGQ